MKTKLLCLALATSVVYAGDDKNLTLRDSNGKIIATVDESKPNQVIRDGNGKAIGTINDTASGRVLRDSNGQITTRINESTDDGKVTVQTQTTVKDSATTKEKK